MGRLPRPPALIWLSIVVTLCMISLVLFIIAKQAENNDRLRANYDALHSEYESLYRDALGEGVDTDAPAPDDVPEAKVEEPRIDIKGDRGAPGPLGPQGPPGPEGKPGTMGPRGLIGPPGIDGLKGSDGGIGMAGINGQRGAPGRDGVDGATGATGPAGSPGADGATGPAGPPGPAGEPGADGAPGKAGAAGSDGTRVTDANCVGSDLVFGYSDGTSSTAPGGCAGGPQGPAGPAGPAGDDGMIAPGSAGCPSGQYVVGVAVNGSGTLSVSCAAVLGNSDP